MSSCYSCSSQVPEGSVFCPHCGTQMWWSQSVGAIEWTVELMYDGLRRRIKPHLALPRWESDLPDYRAFRHLASMDSYVTRFARTANDLRAVAWDGDEYVAFGADLEGLFVIHAEDGSVHYLAMPLHERPVGLNRLNANLLNFVRCYAKFCAAFFELRSRLEWFVGVNYTSLRPPLDSQSIPADWHDRLRAVTEEGMNFVRSVEGEVPVQWDNFWYLLDDGYFDISMTAMLFVRDGLMTLTEVGLAEPDDAGS